MHVSVFHYFVRELLYITIWWYQCRTIGKLFLIIIATIWIKSLVVDLNSERHSLIRPVPEAVIHYFEVIHKNVGDIGPKKGSVNIHWRTRFVNFPAAGAENFHLRRVKSRGDANGQKRLVIARKSWASSKYFQFVFFLHFF